MIWTVLSSPTRAGATSVPSEREMALPTEPIELSSEITLGPDSADVVLIQYSEFQCPFCARFAQDTLRPLVDTYVTSGQLQVVFRHFPLDAIHPHAAAAGAAAACASDQGAFWKLHDFFFEAPENLDLKKTRTKLAELNLDLGEFDSCMVSSGPARVRADKESAVRLGVRATPTIFVGTRLAPFRLQVKGGFVGARPIESVTKLIDRALNER